MSKYDLSHLSTWRTSRLGTAFLNWSLLRAKDSIHRGYYTAAIKEASQILMTRPPAEILDVARAIKRAAYNFDKDNPYFKEIARISSNYCRNVISPSVGLARVLS